MAPRGTSAPTPQVIRLPCDSTLQQLYEGTEFEAYQELGVWSVKAAAANGGLPLA